MLDRRWNNALTTSARQPLNKVAAGLDALEALKLDQLERFLTLVNKAPEEARQNKLFLSLLEIGDLLSYDWQKLSTQYEYKNPDAVLEAISVKIPPSIVASKSIITKLDKLSEIYQSLSQNTDNEKLEAEYQSLLVVLKSLESKAAAIAKSDTPGKKADKENIEDLVAKNELYSVQIDETKAVLKNLRMNIERFSAYDRSLADMYTAINLLQSDPLKMQPFNWLQTVTEQLAVRLSTDPESKAAMKLTYGVFQDVMSSKQEMKNTEKFEIIFKGIAHNYLTLSADASTGKQTFEEFLNTNKKKNHPARMMGLILKAALEHYPACISEKMHSELAPVLQLVNPYNDFLNHVSPKVNHRIGKRD